MFPKLITNVSKGIARGCGILMRFEFEFSFVFEFEFALRYGNKRPIQSYMVIYQIQKVFIFVQKSKNKTYECNFTKYHKKTNMAHMKLTWPIVRSVSFS